MPYEYDAEQLTPQSIPDGDDDTVPAPSPTFDTDNNWPDGGDGGMWRSLSGSPQHSVSTPTVALASIVDHTCDGRYEGLLSSTIAAAPATCGAAIDVPLIVLVAESEPAHAERTSLPGAKRSLQDP